jgi:hypothetical protein
MNVRRFLHAIGLVFDASYEDQGFAVPVSSATLHSKPKTNNAHDVSVSEQGASTILVAHIKETNTFDWGDVSHKAAQAKSPLIDVYDTEQIEANQLNVALYKRFKIVWADGIGAESAGDDRRLAELVGNNRTYRKQYWKAMNAAEAARNGGK